MLADLAGPEGVCPPGSGPGLPAAGVWAEASCQKRPSWGGRPASCDRTGRAPRGRGLLWTRHRPDVGPEARHSPSGATAGTTAPRAGHSRAAPSSSAGRILGTARAGGRSRPGGKRGCRVTEGGNRHIRAHVQAHACSPMHTPRAGTKAHQDHSPSPQHGPQSQPRTPPPGATPRPCPLAGVGEVTGTLASCWELPERLGWGPAGPSVLLGRTGVRMMQTPPSELPGTFWGTAPALGSPRTRGSISSGALGGRQEVSRERGGAPMPTGTPEAHTPPEEGCAWGVGRGALRPTRLPPGTLPEHRCVYVPPHPLQAGHVLGGQAALGS